MAGTPAISGHFLTNTPARRKQVDRPGTNPLACASCLYLSWQAGKEPSVYQHDGSLSKRPAVSTKQYLHLAFLPGDERHVALQCATQSRKILVAAHFSGTQGSRVIGQLLDIEQLEPAQLQPANQMDQRDF